MLKSGVQVQKFNSDNLHKVAEIIILSQNCLLAVQACKLGITLFNIRKKNEKERTK